MNLALLSSRLSERNEPAYRLAQVKRAYFVDLKESWDEISTLSKDLRSYLSESVPFCPMKVVRVQESNDGRTVKTLLECADGKKIEAVLMRHDDDRNTVCVSSQVGCAMACTFCATGTMGLKRNLTAEEIYEQVLHYARWLKPRGARVTNVVLMGMGEPFHNYDEMMKALRTLNDPEGFNLGARHMSISTCGVVPGILRLADEEFQVNLAISLHSAIDERRTGIMPVNRAYPLKKLMDAVHMYMEKTNRKVFFEYLLLDGINDREEDAQALKKLFGKDLRLVHLNLIKYHDTEAFTGTARADRMEFLERLHELGIPATHRITFGEDIDAACGQLAVNEDKGELLQGKKAIRENKAAKQKV